jgi:carboxyl-terminal processing protease
MMPLGSRFFVGLALLGLAACSQQQPPPQVAAPPEEGSEFSDDRIFTIAFRQIERRYVESIDIADVAMRGLEEIRLIDPDLTIRRVNDKLELMSSQRLVASLAAPPPHEPDQWAEATIGLLNRASRASALVRYAPRERVHKALFEGALAQLDPYSRYIDPQAAKVNRGSREGFGGIGATISIEQDAVKVMSVIPGTPAAEVGLDTGDVLLVIDGASVSGMMLVDVIERLRGPVGTPITLVISRGGNSAPATVTMRRSIIVPTTVAAIIEDRIAYIRVSGFNQRTASTLARRLTDLRANEPGLRGIVLDLRGNVGGLLDQAIAVADLFVERGRLSATRGRHPDSIQSYDAAGADLSGGLPLVVLVNGRSASASEVVAAALQDLGRAVLIGSTSYGKGTVQTVVRLPNDGELLLTWSRLTSPSGYVIHGLGVLPNLCTNPASGKPVSASVTQDTSAVLARWRTPWNGPTPNAEELRRTCPPSDAEPEIDRELARQIISDNAIYAALSNRNVQAIAARP